MTDQTGREAFSAYCREQLGLDVKEVANIAEVPRRTFYDWWESRNKAVRLIVAGIKHAQQTENVS
ncbi:hypothetical protein [Vibrio marisflavi]|uniref:Uncharacterized protein n=1 Tax=Vibrio marisflavi CECT 7928 TaxID=634439 RepID=A0ABN8EF58_9VIBR|nr:hypothetical protein [Vibrio marisflavi]CAH0543293.1 hypothetical protein VMF7928_04507 [Vibrio marisflavi CECT 7928]